MIVDLKGLYLLHNKQEQKLHCLIRIVCYIYQNQLLFFELYQLQLLYLYIKSWYTFKRNNLLRINFFLVVLNLETNQNFTVFLVAQIVILGIFLLFNFPKAKIFLGDSGSYLFGSIVALNTIYTNNLNPQISSFFFCILLFYLFASLNIGYLDQLLEGRRVVFVGRRFFAHV